MKTITKINFTPLIIAVVYLIIIAFKQEFQNFSENLFIFSTMSLLFLFFIHQWCDKEKVKTFILGVFVGLFFFNGFLDYKGFEWVSDKNNWMDTSPFLWVVLTLFCTIYYFMGLKNDD